MSVGDSKSNVTQPVNQEISENVTMKGTREMDLLNQYGISIKWKSDRNERLIRKPDHSTFTHFSFRRYSFHRVYI